MVCDIRHHALEFSKTYIVLFLNGLFYFRIIEISIQLVVICFPLSFLKSSTKIENSITVLKAKPRLGFKLGK